MLRLSERTSRIEHVPRILYHWRKLPGSIAAATDAKDGIPELQAAAVTAHLERTGVAAFARPHPTLPAPDDPSSQAAAALAQRHGDRADAGRAGCSSAAAWPRSSRARPIRASPCCSSTTGRATRTRCGRSRSTRSRCSRSTSRSTSRARTTSASPRRAASTSVFLNNDTEIRTPEWLEVLVSLAEGDGVGAVGPLLVYPDGTVQHAGVVLGIRGTADHIMRGFPAAADGYAGSLSCTREVSAVTGACLAIGRGPLRGGRRVRRALRDALPGRRPLPAAPAARAAEPVHAARSRAARRGRHPRGPLRPARPRASARRLGRDDRGAATPTTAGGSRSRARTTGRSQHERPLRQLPRLHARTAPSTSATWPRSSSKRASVARSPCREIRARSHCSATSRSRRSTSPERGTARCRFPDGKPPTLVHAWTPREAVRRLTEELSARHGCPYVVHLEDNEDAITASRLGLTLEELHARPLGQVPETLAHPDADAAAARRTRPG